MFYPREAQRDHLYNRIVMLTIACIVLLGIASMARTDGIRYTALLIDPVETTAMVTSVELFPRNTQVGNIHYRYSDDGSSTREAEYFDANYNASTQYQAGAPIQIHYSRWFPSISSTAEQLPTLVPGFYIMIGALAMTLLFFGISFLTFCQISRMKAEDACY